MALRDIMEMMLQVNQLKNQRRQIDLQERNSEVQNLAVLQNVLGSTSAGGRQAYLTQYANRTGVDVTALREAANLTPESMELQRASALGRATMDPNIRAEFEAMVATGMNRGQLAQSQVDANFYNNQGGALGPATYNEALSRRFTGMNTGQVALSQDIARRNPTVHAAMNDIAAGLRMNAGQTAQLGQQESQFRRSQAQSESQFSRSNALSWFGAQNSAEMQRAQLGLSVDQWNAQKGLIGSQINENNAQAQRALRGGVAGGPEGFKMFLDQMDMATKLRKNYDEATTSADREAARQQINALLRLQGYDPNNKAHSGMFRNPSQERWRLW